MNRDNESGFVLITALVLLSILTLLGVTSQYKTMIELKVAGMMVHGERAEAAANAGLVNQYWEWNTIDAAGFDSLVPYVGSGNGVAPIYHGDKTPDTVASALVPTDAEILAVGSGYHVYTFQKGGIVDTIAWGGSARDEPQVAVWATTFVNDTGAGVYPYATPHDVAVDGGCSGCRLVTYALGRSGVTRKLVRETQSVIKQGLGGVSAMTNAPAGDSFSDICAGGNASRTGAANAKQWKTSNDSTVIEITQAPYLKGKVPSGTALASNTAIGGGGKGFRGGTGSTTGTTFESTPVIIYSGHDTYSNVRLDYADVTLDTTGVQMPPGLLPSNLIKAPLLDGYGEVKYFSDPNEQLFEMDAYRWAAEQFVCQTPNAVEPYFDTTNDGLNGNGRYCSKADALRKSLVDMGYPAYAPVTGRLTIAQFQWNVANSIPMFGLVRLMFPAEADGNSALCQDALGNMVTTNLHVIVTKANPNINVPMDIYASTGWDFQKLMAGGTYTGNIPMPAQAGFAFAPSADNVNPNAEPDDDGQLGPNARVILYGSFLIDYFADYNLTGDGAAGFEYNAVFDVAGGERVLGILESPDVYLAIEHNIMLNPSMPRFGGLAPTPFPTAADGANAVASSLALTAWGGGNAAVMNMVDVNDGADASSGKRVNLASPYDGYFPWSEGLLPLAGEGNEGTMRLMSRATVADNPGNVGLVHAMAGNTAPAIPTPDMSTMLNWAKPARPGGTAGTEGDILKYYYDLAKLNANRSNENNWPVANWPGNDLSANFCIGKEDCGNVSMVATPIVDHLGDKTHLMFPSGYMHGWKVALAALDMTADDWNTMLTGIATPTTNDGILSTWEQIQNNCDGTMCRLGRPFSVRDAGLYKAVGLEEKQKRYFYVTKDDVTGYGLLDSDWQDIPTQMYSGGLLDMHAHSNMNGIIYTPGPLEWEPGNSKYDTGVHMSYVTGSIITGYGSYTKNKTKDDRYILVYDPQAVDNIATSSSVVILRRYDWQMLQ